MYLKCIYVNQYFINQLSGFDLKLQSDCEMLIGMCRWRSLFCSEKNLTHIYSSV